MSLIQSICCYRNNICFLHPRNSYEGVLRNPHYVFGVVVYAEADTKIQKSNTKPLSKPVLTRVKHTIALILCSAIFSGANCGHHYDHCDYTHFSPKCSGSAISKLKAIKALPNRYWFFILLECGNEWKKYRRKFIKTHHLIMIYWEKIFHPNNRQRTPRAN